MKVYLMYFKQSGSYFARGLYLTEEVEMVDIWNEVLRKIKHKKLPGLIGEFSDYIVLVQVEGHNDNVFKLLNIYGNDDGINVGGNVSGMIVRGNGNIIKQ